MCNRLVQHLRCLDLHRLVHRHLLVDSGRLEVEVAQLASLQLALARFRLVLQLLSHLLRFLLELLLPISLRVGLHCQDLVRVRLEVNRHSLLLLPQDSDSLNQQQPDLDSLHLLDCLVNQQVLHCFPLNQDLERDNLQINLDHLGQEVHLGSRQDLLHLPQPHLLHRLGVQQSQQLQVCLALQEDSFLSLLALQLLEQEILPTVRLQM